MKMNWIEVQSNDPTAPARFVNTNSIAKRLGVSSKVVTGSNQPDLLYFMIFNKTVAEKAITKVEKEESVRIRDQDLLNLCNSFNLRDSKDLETPEFHDIMTPMTLEDKDYRFTSRVYKENDKLYLHLDGIQITDGDIKKVSPDEFKKLREEFLDKVKSQ